MFTFQILMNTVLSTLSVQPFQSEKQNFKSQYERVIVTNILCVIAKMLMMFHLFIWGI